MPVRTRRDPITQIVAGAVAGVVATYAMDQFQRAIAAGAPARQRRKIAMRQGEPRSKLEQDEPATMKAAGAVVETVAQRPSTRAERRVGGTVLHYLYGATAGAGYGALVGAAGARPAVAHGIGWGLLVWVLADETVTPLLGIAPKPWESKGTSHALAASAHVAFGASLEAARRVLVKVL